MYIKIAEAKRPRLFWICQLFGHWFKWMHVPGHGIEYAEGTCRICLTRRAYKVTWPAPPMPPVKAPTLE